MQVKDDLIRELKSATEQLLESVNRAKQFSASEREQLLQEKVETMEKVWWTSLGAVFRMVLLGLPLSLLPHPLTVVRRDISQALSSKDDLIKKMVFIMQHKGILGADL